MIGLEPTRLTAPDPKSGAAANYATSAVLFLPQQADDLIDGAKIRSISVSANLFGHECMPCPLPQPPRMPARAQVCQPTGRGVRPRERRCACGRAKVHHRGPATGRDGPCAQPAYRAALSSRRVRPTTSVEPIPSGLSMTSQPLTSSPLRCFIGKPRLSC